ncbi:MAG: tetraacyldisaccharide 4'-kinase [Alphaproteobacteria bacterium]|nr:tetraacyldisaccharide 4'-kinase [Alphaproteobacteria bacterium]
MKTPWWFLHKTLLAFLLLPVSWVYYVLSCMVYGWRKMFAYKSRRKIICVGGLFAGGVGKTPIVRVIANRLDTPVVMRGYKRSAKTGNIGDEATMLMNDGIAVHVGHRKSNIMLLNRQKNENGPILMDDGLQNPSIKKDISIFVIDAGLGFGNGFLLPAGPLREPKKHIRRADAIIIIKREKSKIKKLPENVPVFYATNKNVMPNGRYDRIVAFAGIGYPKKFFRALPNVVARRAFGDHYQYTEKDIQNLMNLAKRKNAKLVTTEKDWVRLPENVRDKIKYVRLETNIDEKFFDWLREKLNADDKKVC